MKHVAEVKLVGKEIHVKFRSIREAKNGIKKLDGKTYKGRNKYTVYYVINMTKHIRFWYLLHQGAGILR